METHYHNYHSSNFSTTVHSTMIQNSTFTPKQPKPKKHNSKSYTPQTSLYIDTQNLFFLHILYNTHQNRIKCHPGCWSSMQFLYQFSFSCLTIKAIPTKQLNNSFKTPANGYQYHKVQDHHHMHFPFTPRSTTSSVTVIKVCASIHKSPPYH